LVDFLKIIIIILSKKAKVKRQNQKAKVKSFSRQLFNSRRDPAKAGEF
jgi:hypothetical protein